MTDSDKPTIADAMKNFLALRLANGLTEDEPTEQNAPHLARAVLLAVMASLVRLAFVLVRCWRWWR